VRVVTLRATGAGNCVEVAGERYVFARSDLGSFLLRANCPHRGGPLHLATLAPDAPRLVCPWHNRATSVSRALRAGIPAVRRGDVVTAVFDVADTAEVELGHVPVCDQLARPWSWSDRRSRG
jgi:nitrite reductase (NADH) small subunit